MGSADESTVRLLSGGDGQKESLTAYTGRFRAHKPLNEDDASDRKYIVQSDDEYAFDEVDINICENRGSLLRLWLSPPLRVKK